MSRDISSASSFFSFENFTITNTKFPILFSFFNLNMLTESIYKFGFCELKKVYFPSTLELNKKFKITNNQKT